MSTASNRQYHSSRLALPNRITTHPDDFGDVLDAPGRDAREARLDHGLLDRGLAPAVALDYRGREAHALELRLRMATSPELVVGLRPWWPARYASLSAALAQRSAPARPPAPSPGRPFGASSTVFLASPHRSAFGDPSLKDAMGPGTALLRYASCLDSSSHSGAGRALLPIWTISRRQSAQEIARCRGGLSPSAGARSRTVGASYPRDQDTPTC